MKKEEKQSVTLDKRLAAVYGLYCEACSLFIATTKDSERLKKLAEKFHLLEEACYHWSRHMSILGTGRCGNVSISPF